MGGLPGFKFLNAESGLICASSLLYWGTGLGMGERPEGLKMGTCRKGWCQILGLIGLIDKINCFF